MAKEKELKKFENFLAGLKNGIRGHSESVHLEVFETRKVYQVEELVNRQ